MSDTSETGIFELGLAPDLDCARVVSGVVAAVGPDMVSVTVRGGADAILPASEYPPGRVFTHGQHIYALVISEGPRPVLSVSRPELLTALLGAFSPEVRTGTVRVQALARRPGVRSKVAVAPTVAGVDAVAACVGRQHNRIDALKAALGGEQVDVVAWNPDRSIFLSNALQPAAVSSVTFDESGRGAVATTPAHQMSAAVGQGGLNSALAGQLVGAMVRIVSE